MAYADVQMFMEKLKQLIYCNDIPMINDPPITRERPQFQRLHDELHSMIQTLFIHKHQDLENFGKVRVLQKRFKAAAEEAEDIVDIFLSTVHFRNNGYFPRSDIFHPSLHLEVVMRSIKSIKMDFLTMSIDNMKGDSSQRTDRLPMQSAGSLRTRKSLGSKKLLEKFVVGLDRDVELIRDKLVEDGKQLDVVSIVGMGGLGKTTLANKVFTDPFVAHHFYVRGWVTISQTYEKRDVLIQVLSSMDVKLDLEKATDSQLRGMLHKCLNRTRYLIVIDDIWSKEAWDQMKLFFPDYNTGSRILLTSRLTEVALHAKSHGLIHHLKHLTEEESWELLCRKVFRGDECPEWLIEPGKQIAKSCHGLPLSVVVIAGVLAKEARSNDFWVKVACNVSSYIASDQRGCLETIALSYDHLPLHLRDCFLYLGGFEEDSQIDFLRLTWLWMAEGFIQHDGIRSLQEIAESYVMDLIDRNLLIVEKWFISGEVTYCKVHDLVRQLCLEKLKEERFFMRIDWPPSEQITQVIATYKQRRVLTNQEIYIASSTYPPTPSIRSLFCYYSKPTFIYNTAEYFHSFALLRVLNLANCTLIDFPPGLALLVHLRYLEIWQSLFPSPLCSLWNLQTLVVGTIYSSMVLPSNISNLVNLRHLSCNTDLYLPSIGKPMKLEFITNVVLGDGIDNFKKCFPRIKQLTSTLYSDKENDFEILHYLQDLKLIGSSTRKMESDEPEFVRCEPKVGKNHIRFPATLEILELVRCRLPWSDMLIIQSLPKLEVLILRDNGFEGTVWETGEEQFQKLRYLWLENLNVRQWKASSNNFPCLQDLDVQKCVDLEEIPFELGNVPTLKFIAVLDCSASLSVSLQKLRQEQDDVGNCELKIILDEKEMTSCALMHED